MNEAFEQSRRGFLPAPSTTTDFIVDVLGYYL
jgi:hypothetical protein